MAGQHNGMRYNFGRQETQQETPLFERQMGSEELIELQQMRTINENLHQRIIKLEKINMDLEGLLEDQAKISMAVETECTQIKNQCEAKNQELLAEIEKWKTSFRQEQLKGDRLREQVHRSERELYGILQRKHELMRGPGTKKQNLPPMGKGGGSAGADGFTARRGEHSSTTSMRETEHLLSGNKKHEKSKEITVLGSLSDFLGF